MKRRVGKRWIIRGRAKVVEFNPSPRGGKVVLEVTADWNWRAYGYRKAEQRMGGPLPTGDEVDVKLRWPPVYPEGRHR